MIVLDKTSKILIVVVIILVAGLSFSVGLLIERPVANNTNNNSTNQNITVNNSSSTSDSDSSTSNQEIKPSYYGDGRPCHYCGSRNTDFTHSYKIKIPDVDGSFITTTVNVRRCNYCGKVFENQV